MNPLGPRPLWFGVPRPGLSALLLILMLVLAIGLRGWILLQPDLGLSGDLAYFTRWMRGLGEHGLAGFYRAEPFCDYPPFMVLTFQALGWAIHALVSSPDDRVFHLAIKLVSSFADLAIGAMLFRQGQRLFGPGGGTLVAGLYLLNPVAIYDSAYWGQVDAIYTAFVLGSIILAGQRRWVGAGVVGALGLLAKFQAIAILPLVAFEAFRLGGIRAVARTAAGALVAAVVIAVPFVATGTLDEVTRRAYVDVVGQYQTMSNNAFNLWYLLGDPGAPDTAPPRALLTLAARGDVAVDAGGSWLLGWTWRRISVVIFAVSVAVVLSVYGRRPGNVARYGAAGLLALSFYLFPTEMHERYAFPAIALLAPWAAAHRVHERVYAALTITLLLNLAAVLPPGPLAPPIAAANVLLFAGILALVVIAGTLRPDPVANLPTGDLLPATAGPDPDRSGPDRPGPDQAGLDQAGPDQAGPDQAGPDRPVLIRVLERATMGAVVLGALVALIIPLAATLVSRRAPQADSVWLSSLVPTSARQGWGKLSQDRSASGAPLAVDGRYYLYGLGTHAPASLVFAVPPGATRFETLLGIDAASGEKGGSVRVTLLLDGETAYQSPVITGASGAVPVRVEVRQGEVLTIEVDPTPDGQRSDHLDLALARFVGGAPE